MDKQQFLFLGNSARGRALCELISRATAEPGIFTFGELLSLPNVQEVGTDALESGSNRCFSA
jgi:COP9 signalosome complex subunit 7